MVKNSIKFVKDAWDELHKVHRPTKEETWRTVIVVITMIFFSSVFLGLTDYVAGTLMRRLLSVG